jgi:phosphoenolpyruvate phosphomutase
MNVNKIISKKDFSNIKLLLKPLVFVPMAVDLLHQGHIRILNKSSKLGTVIVLLITDDGLRSYKGHPLIKYKYRKEIINALKQVDYVIPLNGLLFIEICEIIRPEYFVHGTDWKRGPQSIVRKKLIKAMRAWSGKVVEFSYTNNISSAEIKKKILKNQ